MIPSRRKPEETEKGPWRENPRRVGGVGASQPLCGPKLWSPGSRGAYPVEREKGHERRELEAALVAERGKALEGTRSP
jgi:hypothetical protein